MDTQAMGHTGRDLELEDPITRAQRSHKECNC